MKPEIKWLTLLLIFILAITAVSANDGNNNITINEQINSDIQDNQVISESVAAVEDNSTNVDQSNNQQTTADENEILGSSDNNDVLSAEATSFKELQKLIDNHNE